MALGKYTRIDTRRQSTNYCSTVTIVVFVALCLVGVWMMTSSSVVPGQSVDVPAQENKHDVKEPLPESKASNPKQFEDSPGDLPEDATKGDTNVSQTRGEDNSNTQENQEVKVGEKQEEKSEEKQDEGNKSDDVSNNEKQNGENNTEDGDSKTPDGETNTDSGDTKTNDGENNGTGQGDSEENSKENKSELDETEKNPATDETEMKSDENSGGTEKKSDTDDTETKPDENSGDMKEEKTENQTNEKVDVKDNKESEKTSDEQANNQSGGEVFPSGAQSEILNETATQSGSWSTQAAESKNEKEAQLSSNHLDTYNWKTCNVTAGPDYIPCLDNWQAIRRLRSTKHYEHRERHCPQEPPTCLVPLPEGYKRPIEWPKSREKVCKTSLYKFNLFTFVLTLMN